MSKQETWSLQDHLCKACGGRILKRAGGPSVMTAGGNPIYRCADCGIQTSSMGPESLCWCGFGHRGQNSTAYLCRPFSEILDKPELKDMFLACGCDPKRGISEIGIVLEKDYRELCKKYM